MTRVNRTDADTAPLKTTSVTDPTSSSAVTADIVDTYSGVIITTTTTGNAQTIASPTNTGGIQRFSVINNDTSTDAITINGASLAVGEVRYYVWDGSAWAAESVGNVTLTGTETLTNKRITARVNTIASSATPTPAGDTTDEFTVTALAAAAAFAAPTGTPTEGQVLLIRIKDDGTARALTWNAISRASTDLALPTTTVLSKTMYLQFVYNNTDSKWDLLGLLNNF